MGRSDYIEDDLFPFYALDALTGEERAEVDAYVAENPAARARLLAVVETAATLGDSVKPVVPAPAVKSGLMARVGADVAQSAAAVATTRRIRPVSDGKPKAQPSRPRWQVFMPALAGVAALALVIGGLVLWQMSQELGALRQQVVLLQQETAALQGEVGLLRAENQMLRGELSARDDLLAQYRRPGAVTIAIGDSTGQNPAGSGTLTMDPATGDSVLSVANLPPSGPGETYQAWLIIDETPVSVGTFDVDVTGLGSIVIAGALPGSFDLVGVSREPEGGSEQPTPGNIVLLGGLAG